MIPQPVPVAHVITRLDVGGAQETAVRICGGLDRTHWAPILIAGDDVGSGGSLRAEADRLGVPVQIVKSLRSPVSPIADIRAERDIAALLRDTGARVVQTHSSKAGVLGRQAAHRIDADAVIHTVHGWSFNDSQPRLVAATYRSIERMMARRTDAIVVVSNADRVSGLASGIGRSDQYEIVRSGIPLVVPAKVDRAAVRVAFGWDDADVVVVSVGRLEAQKDPIALVEAFALAHKRHSCLRLVLIGDGSLAGDIRETALRHEVDGRVQLLGLRHDVPHVIAAADAFALASRWEGLPRAVLEAMRARLPVVATDTGGVNDILSDGETGRLVPVGDTPAFAAAIAEVASHPDSARRWAANALARLPEFSESKMLTATVALYRRLLGLPVTSATGVA